MAKKKLDENVSPRKEDAVVNEPQVVAFTDEVNEKEEKLQEKEIVEVVETVEQVETAMDIAIQEQLSPKSDIEAGRGDFKVINEAIEEAVMEKPKVNKPLNRRFFGYAWNGQIFD